MSRNVWLPLVLVFAAGLLRADDPVVFKSDVALVRVDAQVLDRNNRAVTGLRADDFVLREDGKVQEIRNFASENMPVDVLLLFDVSASMRPHVERIAFAARESMRVLASQDRVAIMVFDRRTRLRMPFRSDLDEVDRQLQGLLRQETFNGGTDITRALYDAAAYIGREGRRDARRAIVILTDDQTERDRDENGVANALDNAGAVLSFLQAPDAMQGRYGNYPGGRRRGGYPGGGYPRGGGGMGGPDIIFGRRYPGGGYPGGGYPGGGGGGPVILGPHTHSAGTAEIARRTGGDTIPVDDASALETTLSRIRQRYALHFYLPADVKAGQNPTIQVALASSARSRYPDAEVRFRRVNMSGGTDVNRGGYEDARGTSSSTDPVVVSRAPSATDQTDQPRRRRGVSDGTGGPRGPVADRTGDNSAQGGWHRTDDPSASAPATTSNSGWQREGTSDSTTNGTGASPAVQAKPANGKPDDNSNHGGWRKATPEDVQPADKPEK